MKKIKPLASKQFDTRTDPKQFDFETTAELRDLPEFVGQGRAIKAIQFAVGIHQEGFNLFALGPHGIGKHSIVRKILKKEAMNHPTPSDWCYVYNFKEPQKPIALELPPGWGAKLKHDMQMLIDDLSTSIPSIFESEEYRNRLQKLTDKFSVERERIFKKLEHEAKAEHMKIISSPSGFVVGPTSNKGEMITPEEFDRLGLEEKLHKKEIMENITKKLEKFLKEIPALHKKKRHKERELEREFVMPAVWHLIDKLKSKYYKFPTVINYLEHVQQDLVVNASDFIKPEEETSPTQLRKVVAKPKLIRYQANVIVDHSKSHGAPIVYEDNPTLQNLIGYIEQISLMGTFVTDFTLIRPGVLHYANGGFLIMDIRHILQQPNAWKTLKRILYAHRITIEPAGQMQGLVGTPILKPKSIPLNVKIILLGDRHDFYFLSEFDPDLKELFKVSADFEEDIIRDRNNLKRYARLIATLARKDGLRHIHKRGVARIIDYSSRFINDSKKLSIHMRTILDLLRGANYWAQIAKRKVIEEQDIQTAIKNQIHRVDRAREVMQEEVLRKIVLIDTHRKIIGQVNGLSVVQLGDFSFGYPSRITAVTHAGKGDIIDIQREIDLSGAIHSKGVLTLSGFLNGRFALDAPLSLSASVVFEQTYGFVDGDSASVAELCAILSSLAHTPIKQGLAVTGSINQLGDVQAIGDVNDKIEGFFDICKFKGLTGEQGVLIPAANVQHLILREDVIKAAKHKLFHIYSIQTVDEAMSILTGVEVGKRDKNGNFPRNSLNYRIEKRIGEFAERVKEEGGGGKR